MEPQLAANRRFWTGWAKADPDTDLAIYRSDVPHVLFNGVMRARDVPLDEAVAEARQRLAGSSWCWWVGDDSDEGVAEHLLDHGAEHTTSMPVMAADLTETVEQPLPEGLTVRHVTDRAGLWDLVTAYAGPLGFPLDGLGTLIESNIDYLARDPELIHLTGALDGKTVGTAVVSLSGDVAALYCIATDADHRKRGVATALTLEAMRIAREAGHEVATLQASSMGRPVYERIGFTTVSHYRLFEFGPAEES
ncbi:GNAT family N-acetyltransferase [Actinomadura sp. DC4]|uniref:GNAT family N-acetyltransferase n=1 Tax=Actinomadura sp. DC4 TaxID=3055069 RepID=UPI0025B278BE|nr:GNAT family N-acetyltransferase [Actinomadura sp. DC4]MDN3357265.1 GNAT family N-acetyltransferase [Actinomadura sp. DC4]